MGGEGKKGSAFYGARTQSIREVGMFTIFLYLLFYRFCLPLLAFPLLSPSSVISFSFFPLLLIFLQLLLLLLLVLLCLPAVHSLGFSLTPPVPSSLHFASRLGHMVHLSLLPSLPLSILILILSPLIPLSCRPLLSFLHAHSLTLGRKKCKLHSLV